MKRIRKPLKTSGQNLKTINNKQHRGQSRYQAICISLLTALALGSSAFADQIWAQRYDGPGHGDDLALAMALDKAGNVIVTGQSKNANGDYDFYTAKYSPTGDLLWEQRYDGHNHADDVATAVAVDNFGNVLVAGYLAVANSPTDPGHILINTEFCTVKYSADGLLLWDHVGPDHGTLNADPGRDSIKLALDSAGNVIVSGAWQQQFYTAKYSADQGSTLWERTHCGSCQEIGFPLGDWPAGVAVDHADNIVVTGTAYVGPYPGNADFYTVKYAADGTHLWDGYLDGPAGLRERAMGLALDQNGNVIVTGWSQNQNNTDYYTAKYLGADGTLLWTRRFDGGFDDSPASVGVDSSGAVFVTGWSAEQSGQQDYYTIKYTADGELVWAQRYDSCDHNGDNPNALAVDGAGNVLVTGFSIRTGASSDYYTIKYAGLDGHPLWHQRFNGGGGDVAYAVSVDAAGSVLVTGYSDNSSGNKDYYTVKYQAAGNAPAIVQCPANLTVAANLGQCSAPVSFTATATDDECESLPVTCSPASGSIFPKGTTTVTCTASDGSTCSFTVTVNDTEKPVITCPANIVTSIPCGQSSAAVTFTASATDNCPGVSVSCSPPSGSIFPAGVTTVNCSAHDSSGNSASGSFTVTVNATIFAFTGFLSPVGGADATGGSFASPLRTFKLNSTIPVKFTASCGGSPVLSGIHRLQVIKYSDQTTAATPIDATPTDAATTGDQFRLTDSSIGQWQFNLDTKATGMSAGIWLLQAMLSDGSQHTAWIQIK